jgi:hypothetical protein
MRPPRHSPGSVGLSNIDVLGIADAGSVLFESRSGVLGYGIARNAHARLRLAKVSGAACEAAAYRRSHDPRPAMSGTATDQSREM